MNYGDLRTQFLALLNRSDCTDAQAILFIKQGVARIQRKLRVPSMEKVSLTVSEGSLGYVNIPSNFIELIELTYNGKPLDKLSYREFARIDGNLSTPSYFARLAQKFLITSTAEAGAELVLYYYGEFSAFVNDAAENELSASNADLIIYGALAYAGDFFDHDKAQTWEAMFESLLDEAQTQADTAEAAGGSWTLKPSTDIAY